MRATAVNHLMTEIERNLALAARIEAALPAQRQALDQVQRWQRQRLDATYADLRAQPRYRPACDFFLDELYGGRDVHQRDRQLERAAPVMRRFLPEHLLAAVGDAMRLQAISLEFDFALAQLMAHDLQTGQALDQARYAEAYRQHGHWDGRLEQLNLIRELGHLLDKTVQKPLVHRLIGMMRGPAMMAGFGTLQEFLSEGLKAFATMHGADHFLTTIYQRELAALNAMRQGESKPFADWQDGPKSNGSTEVETNQTAHG